MSDYSLIRETVAQLHRAIVQSLYSPDLKETLQRDGSDPVGNRPEEFAAFITSEIQKWTVVVKKAGIKAEKALVVRLN